MFAHIEENTKKVPVISLRDSEEKYRLLVENVNDSIVISQKDKFIYFNQQFANMLGYEYDELMMMDYREVYTQKGLNILSGRAIERQKGNEVSSRYETVFIKKDKKEVFIEANVTIIDYNGEKATFAVIRDITSAKIVKKNLQKIIKDTRHYSNYLQLD